MRHIGISGFLVVAAAAGIVHPAAADNLAAGAPAMNFNLTAYVTDLDRPTDFRFLPDGRLAITEKGGALKIRKSDGTVVVAGTLPAADDPNKPEQGLLGVEVHPNFATNKTLFFYYSLADASGGTDLDRQRVVVKTLGDDNKLAAAETVLLKNIRGPNNHDGGSLALSADGKYLYVGVGDTGCNSNAAPKSGVTPTNFFGTCLTNANGKILRIGLDGSIPSDNPLVGMTAVTKCSEGVAMTCGDEHANITGTGTGAPRAEIWAWGFRNPWRTWVNPKTGLLWVGDVGEITYEEIDIVQPGRHHGWPWREAAHGWPITKCNDVMPGGDCVEPIHECQHDASTPTEDGDCQSITAGLIVDSCTWPPAYRGKYVYGDASSANLWTMDVTAGRDGLVKGTRKDFAKFDGSGYRPVSIHLGPDGNLYIAVYLGRIVQIKPKTPLVCPVMPDASTGDDASDAPNDLRSDATTEGGGGTGGGGKQDGAAGNDGGDAASEGPGTAKKSGCSCRTPGGGDPAGAGFVLLGLPVLVLARRRRSEDQHSQVSAFDR